MSQKTPSAQLLVADGAGGMRTVEDHRFSDGAWPISFVVDSPDAPKWMAHLHAECESRGWLQSGITQIDAEESSGSLSLRVSGGETAPILAIAWEKLRDKCLLVRAAPSSDPELLIEVARKFFAAVDARVTCNTVLREHRRTWLTYDVLPWRGELWLDCDLRLGPPSKHPDTLFGPQIVAIDAMVEGIGSQGVNTAFATKLSHLRIFLSVVIGARFDVVKWSNGWMYETDEKGQVIDCRVATLGYVETASSPGFPVVGSAPAIERRAVSRPGIGKIGVTIGICADMTERWVPEDINALWLLFSSLAHHKREQFVKAGNAYLIAQSLWPEQRTAHASFLVVACEALKPTGRRFDGINVYDVVESLVGPGAGESLRALSVRPQEVRSGHFHRGNLLAGELGALLLSDPFHDPSFDEMLRVLAKYARVCLIEWLRCNGEYPLLKLSRSNNPNHSF